MAKAQIARDWVRLAVYFISHTTAFPSSSRAGREQNLQTTRLVKILKRLKTRFQREGPGNKLVYFDVLAAQQIDCSRKVTAAGTEQRNLVDDKLRRVEARKLVEGGLHHHGAARL